MRKFIVVLLPALLILMTTCKLKNSKVDIIVHNARIYAVDSSWTMASAMAIKSGKIEALGSDEDILGAFDATEVIDLGGAIVYPGFIDAHCHFLSYGLGLIQRADLRGTGSFEEVLERVSLHHQNNPRLWVEGRGWDQNDWEIKDFPDKGRLDELFPDVPVILTRIDGHAALVNSEALRRAGISASTRVTGGEVLLKDGEPTGILIDNAINLVTAVIPDPDTKTKTEALLSAAEHAHAAGLTGLYDAGTYLANIRLIDSLQQSGKLKMRVQAMLTPYDPDFEAAFAAGKISKERLKVNSVKLYSDGALGSRGAALLEPYSDDPGNTGLILHPEEYYHDICKRAYDEGFQVNTHAIGDRGNRFILEIYSKYLEGKNDRRWRVEHAQVVHPDDFGMFGKYSIIPSIQATHATSDMYWAGERLGSERLKHSYAYQELLKQNGWLPNGTDFPIERIEPLLTFYASVARKDLDGWPEGGFQMENALSREQALKSITIWAAKAGFAEPETGSLEPGKQADFVVLDQDLMEVPEKELPEIRILYTFIAGEKVFSSMD
ncbi:MAG: amidohydrolase [Bacteroidetes bacterium]|nr:amidohydrolase [Bacteroidota bacterium]